MVKKQKIKEFNIAIGEIGISFLFAPSLFDNKINYIKNEFITQNRGEIKLNIHHGNVPGNGLKKRFLTRKATGVFAIKMENIRCRTVRLNQAFLQAN